MHTHIPNDGWKQKTLLWNITDRNKSANRRAFYEKFRMRQLVHFRTPTGPPLFWPPGSKHGSRHSATSIFKFRFWHHHLGHIGGQVHMAVFSNFSVPRTLPPWTIFTHSVTESLPPTSLFFFLQFMEMNQGSDGVIQKRKLIKKVPFPSSQRPCNSFCIEETQARKEASSSTQLWIEKACLGF